MIDENGDVVAIVKNKPLEAKGFFEVVADLPRRGIGLVSKLIGVKGLIFGVATWLAYIGKIETWGWVVIALFFVVGREIFKYLKDFR